MPSEQEQSVVVDRATLSRIRTSMALLQQNSEGCATNHYGGDHELFGMPGWLADTRADLDRLTATLSNQMDADKALMPEAAALPAKLDQLAASLDGEYGWHVGRDVLCPAAKQMRRLRSALETIARKTSVTFGRGTMSGEEAAGIAASALTTPTPVEEPEKGATGEASDAEIGRIEAVAWAIANAHPANSISQAREAIAALAATNAGQVEAAAKVISRYTYALPANDPADCGEWDEMSETARNVYRIAAKAALTNGQATGESK